MRYVLLLLFMATAALGASYQLNDQYFSGFVKPTTTGGALGGTSNRWAGYFSSVNTTLSDGVCYVNSGALASNTNVSNTELGYLDGVTSALQTQLDGKQPLDATLSALAALDGTAGFLAVTGADTFARRTFGATAPLNISNGAGGGNPTLTCDVASGSQPGCLASADFTTFSNKQAGPLTGDVTTSGAAATIANDAVSNAKLANMANSTVKCRTTAGTGDPEDCTATQAQNIVGGVVQRLAEQTTPSAPASGYMNIYPKSDGKLYKQTSAGVETEVGSGGGAGAFNMAVLDTAGNSWAVSSQTSADAESSVGNWAAYADAAATTPVDMTGGSPNTTCTRNTSSPINGTGDFKMTITTGATRQGEGCSLLVNIPTAYRGQPIRILAPYTTTGTISSGDIVPYAYDVTNGALLAPSATVSGISGSAGTVYFTIAPQASAAQLRIGWHIARASNTGAVTVNWDDFKVEPDLNQANVPMSDWVAWTPTGSWNTNVTYTGYWRRVGDQLEADVKISLSGAPNNTALSITFPNGLTLDSSKITSQTTGYGHLLDNGSRVYDACITTNSSTSIAVNYCDGATNALSTTNPFTWASGDAVYAHFSVPISGWSSGGGTSPKLSLSDWTENTSIFTINNFAHSNAKVATRRVGDTLLVRGQFTGGSASASTASIDISGYKIDTAKIGGSTSATRAIGTWIVKTGSSNIYSGDRAGIVFFDGSDTDSVFFAYQVSGNDFTKNNASQLVSSGHIFEFEFAIPVAGWTSVSTGTLTAPRDYFNLDTGNGLGSTDTYTRRFTNTNASVGNGFTISDSSTLGTKVTIVTPGNWCFNYSDTRTSGTGVYGISVNDSALTTGIYSMTYAQGRRQTSTSSSANAPIHVGWCGYLNVGDVVRAKVNDTSSQSTSAYTEFSGARMSN